MNKWFAEVMNSKLKWSLQKCIECISQFNWYHVFMKW